MIHTCFRTLGTARGPAWDKRVGGRGGETHHCRSHCAARKARRGGHPLQFYVYPDSTGGSRKSCLLQASVRNRAPKSQRSSTIATPHTFLDLNIGTCVFEADRKRCPPPGQNLDSRSEVANYEPSGCKPGHRSLNGPTDRPTDRSPSRGTVDRPPIGPSANCQIARPPPARPPDRPIAAR